MDPRASGIARYERASVAYGSSTPSADVGALCLACHDPSSEDHEAVIRVPSRGSHVSYSAVRAERGAVLASLSAGDRAAWEGWGAGEDPRAPFLSLGATSYSSATEVTAATNAVFCLTCHKAHGSSYAFALRDDARGLSVRLCRQCHSSVIGGVPAPAL